MRWPWQKKALSSSDLALAFLNDAASKTGVNVTPETVLQASTALACSRVIAEGLAQVPLKLYRKLDNGGSAPATEHPLYATVARNPNPWITSFEWRETAGLHLALGNRSYAYINRTEMGKSKRVELLPIPPGQVRTERLDRGENRYFI